VVAALLGGSAIATETKAADALAGMTPVGASALSDVNIHNNLITSSEIANTATQTGNTVSAKSGGQIINGAIQNNSIANNSGITAAMMNTGNNVNFNNAMIVNVIIPQH
jgi:hypothetical protein